MYVDEKDEVTDYMALFSSKVILIYLGIKENQMVTFIKDKERAETPQEKLKNSTHTHSYEYI